MIDLPHCNRGTDLVFGSYGAAMVSRRLGKGEEKSGAEGMAHIARDKG